MAQIVRTDKDELNTTISLTIQTADYLPKFKKELNKQQREAHLKGFRKGKTPMSFVKKMYGKSLFAKVMNEELQKQLFDYLEEENIKYLGQPLEAEGYQMPEIDYRNIQDYEFRFDLGLYPQFELQGADSTQELERPTLSEYSEAKVEEQIEQMRKQQGKQVSVEDGTAEENDMLVLEAKELEGDAIKEGGVRHEFRILLNENIEEAAKTEFIGKQKGDSVRLNIYELEKKTTEVMVRKYFLGLKEGEGEEMSDMFELEIKDIKRLELAEMTEEFFQKISGGEFSTLEEAKGVLSKNMKEFYTNQMNVLLDQELRERLLAQNDFGLPDEFMKRWLVTSAGQTAEQVAASYEDELRESLRWSVIVEKITAAAELKVEKEEIYAGFRAMFRSNYGIQGLQDDVLNGLVDNVLEKEPRQYEQMRQGILEEKAKDYLRGQITIVEKTATSEEMDNIIKNHNEAMQAKQAAKTSTAATVEQE